MKWFWLPALVLLFLPDAVRAQQKALIAASRMNILYAGIYNPLEILVSGYRCDQIIVNIDNGEIRRDDDCSFTAIPKTTGTATITIRHAVKRDTILLYQAKFQVRALPAPVAKIGGKSTGAMSANVLKAQLGIAAVLEGFDINVMISVIHYTLMIVKPSCVGQVYTSNSPYFTAEMQRALSEITAGDHLFITDIKAKMPQEIPSV